MVLAPGSRLGGHEIIALLGEGGMGKVYRARDGKLNREVAIKVIREDVASDHDRLARFTREAQVLASLNHPNIAQVHGFEDSDGNAAIVLELVEGPTLADRLLAGRLPLAEAIAIARQLADALDAAHEHGVVHRDLKPANIKLRPDGVVKVLDFGLAKTAAPRAGEVLNSPTITSPALTLQGTLLGTAAYMAPEQARGASVDRRADLWAFGAIVYEMLTGESAFGGGTVSDCLANVLARDLDWQRLPPGTPAPIHRLVRRCLERDPKRRLQSAGDARIELDEALTGAPAEATRVESARRRWPLVALPWGLAGASTIGLAWAILAPPRLTPPGAPAPTVLRYTVNIPSSRMFGAANFSLSPDGQTLVFAATPTGGMSGTLHVRPLDALAWRPVGAGTTIRSIAWGNDSRLLAIHSAGDIQIVDLTTGSTQELSVRRHGTYVHGAITWGGDSLLQSLGASGVQLLSTSTGTNTTPRALPIESNTVRLFPFFLPDHRRYLFVQRRPGQSGEICLGNIESAAARCLGIRSESRVLFASGALLYLSGRNLFAHPFDEPTETFRGDPVRLAGDVALGVQNLGAFSASNNGRLAYRTGEAGAEEFVWVDRSGRDVSRTEVRQVILNFDLASDGRSVVFSDGHQLWTADLARGVTSRSLIVEDGGGVSPVLSPDGRRIAIAGRGEERLMIYDASGASKPQLFETIVGLPEDWSPDGRWIGMNTGILVPASGVGEPVRFADRPSGVIIDELAFSPDSRWMTFNLGGRNAGPHEVYVSAVPPTGERWQVSTNGGVQGRWSRDGREIYYLSPDGVMMAVPVDSAGSRPVFGRPHALFKTPIQVSSAVDQFAVGPDGRFLLSRPLADPDQEAVTMIVNWPSLLKRRPE